MNKIYILTSIPGAGKTTWANKFKEENPNTFIVSSDEIRKELGGTYKYLSDEKTVWDLFFKRANELANTKKDINVILDSTCVSNFYRKDYFEKTNVFDEHILVFFDVPFSVCKVRNIKRDEDKIVPDYAMDNLSKIFEKPSEEIINLYDKIIKIDN